MNDKPTPKQIPPADMAGQHFPSGYHETLYASYNIRKEMEDRGGFPPGYTPYQPTDWAKHTKADERELLAGFDPDKNGACTTCGLVRAANGSCDCD